MKSRPRFFIKNVLSKKVRNSQIVAGFGRVYVARKNKTYKKTRRKLSKMKKISKKSKNFQKGYGQIRFYVVNYGKTYCGKKYAVGGYREITRIFQGPSAINENEKSGAAHLSKTFNEIENNL